MDSDYVFVSQLDLILAPMTDSTRACVSFSLADTPFCSESANILLAFFARELYIQGVYVMLGFWLESLRFV